MTDTAQPRLYESVPSDIEAIQWTGDNADFPALIDFAGDKVVMHGRVGPDLPAEYSLSLVAGVDGAQGPIPVPVGHWIVSEPGDRSNIWPVAPDYFATKYRPKASDRTAGEGAA